MDEMQEHFGKPIDVYTSKDAEEDGILVDVTELRPGWKKGLFNYVTTNLLSMGYSEMIIKDSDFDRCEFNIPNIFDLLNQSLQIVKEKSKNFTEPDTFFSGEIELPSGEKQQIFIAQNETRKFTIMLPGDE